MRPPDDREETAWAAFDASLRELDTGEPPAGLRERCLPAARRVLVIDDEPAIRRLIQVRLERAGYRVRCARDGEEGLAAARAERPDLIILDVLMPGRNGFEVLEALKEEPATGEIPVIMLTARSGDDPMRHGLQAGADLYLAKPFDPEELVSIVNRMAAVLGTPENPPPLRRWLK